MGLIDFVCDVVGGVAEFVGGAISTVASAIGSAFSAAVSVCKTVAKTVIAAAAMNILGPLVTIACGVLGPVLGPVVAELIKRKIIISFKSYCIIHRTGNGNFYILFRSIFYLIIQISPRYS